MIKKLYTTIAMIVLFFLLIGGWGLSQVIKNEDEISLDNAVIFPTDI